MDATGILKDQAIRLKRGRLNGLGYEPAFNSFFDYYLSSKYIDPPLLQLEDVTFFLFLRKNLNDQNPNWKMPSFKQMTRKFRIGQHRIEKIMGRLTAAQLLQKESGKGAGREGENINNHYLLSDPLPTLDEFLTVAAEGMFGQPLKEEWRLTLVQHHQTPYSQNGYSPLAESAEPPIAETASDQQTLKTQQTVESAEEQLWKSVLAAIKMQVTYNVFQSFVSDTRLLAIEGTVARVITHKPFAIDWLRPRMQTTYRKLLNMELRLRDGAGAGIIEEIQVEVFSSPSEV